MKIALVDSGRGLLYLLNELIINNIKHEYHLFFTSTCPIGNLSRAKLKEEADIIKNKVKNFDKVIICCNTLSPYFDDSPKYIKILNYNKKYLLNHKNVIPIGTKNTIEYLGQGYKDINLAKDIERRDEQGIIDDIKKWPKASSYLLLCTHYIQAKDIISKIWPKTKVIDLTHLLFLDIASFKKDDELKIISHK